MKKKTFIIKEKVWKWPGDIAWHFINIDQNISKQIKDTTTTYGSGFVKVKAEINKTTWETALFPQKRTSSYIMSIKANIRKKEDIWEGEEIKVKITLL